MKTSRHIADRIRLFIATRQFQVGDVMPSTRELGRQLGASFHTVRKAYHQLVQEGMLRSERGRGFVVNRQNMPLDKSQRLEMGAERLRTVLEELIGNGLDEEEIEALFQEQLGFMEWPDRLESCATAGRTHEQATMIAQAIRRQVGINSDSIAPDEFNKLVKYDALFVPLSLMRHFREESESTLLLPVVCRLPSSLLISLSERTAVVDVGVVSAEEATLGELIEELKLSLRLPGSILAGVVYGKSLPLFAREVDMVLYTPDVASLVERQIPEKRRMLVSYEIDPRTVEIIRSELWDQ